ncbi:hypothetical protein WA026_011075, partial [Henosepilachna vigintioctopunctata]
MRYSDRRSFVRACLHWRGERSDPTKNTMFSTLFYSLRGLGINVRRKLCAELCAHLRARLGERPESNSTGCSVNEIGNMRSHDNEIGGR